MALETYESTGHSSTETNVEKTRTPIKFTPYATHDERMTGMVLVETRSGEGKHGRYIIVFLDDIVNKTEHTFIINVPEEENRGIWDRNFAKTFLYVDEETGYHMVQDKFIGKPVWFGRAVIPGKKYYKFEWGFDESGETVETPSSGISSDVEEVLADMLIEGENKINAAKALIKQFGMKASEAKNTANAYYDANQ